MEVGKNEEKNKCTTYKLQSDIEAVLDLKEILEEKML